MTDKIFLLFVSFVMLFPVMLKTNKQMKKKITGGQANPIDNIKAHTKMISIPRQIESDGLYQVKKYVGRIMKEIGMSVQEQKFTHEYNGTSYKLSNIIGTNLKSSGPYIFFGAHIDSHQFNNSEASIDSAAPIGIILELVRNLLAVNPLAPIMIVFFDGEEAIGGNWNKDSALSGSKYFVQSINPAIISRAYIFDLIGGDIGQNKIGGFSNMPNTFADLRALAKINKKLYGSHEQIFISPEDFIGGKLVDDDHVPFVKKGIWVCNFIPWKFPAQHHKPSDTYSNLNWRYIEIFYYVMYKFFKLLTN